MIVKKSVSNARIKQTIFFKLFVIPKSIDGNDLIIMGAFVIGSVTPIVKTMKYSNCGR